MSNTKRTIRLDLSLTRTIAAHHFILRLRLSKLLASFVAKFSHVRVFRTKTLRIMRGPPDMRLVEYICPFRVVLLLLALGGNCIHKVLVYESAAGIGAL